MPGKLNESAWSKIRHGFILTRFTKFLRGGSFLRHPVYNVSFVSTQVFNPISTMGKEQSKIKPRDLNELSRTTTFSQQEIKAYYKEFKKNSKTGTMTVSDFKQLYSNFFPDGDSSEFAEHTFRVFDENGDGVLDFRELIVSMSVMKRGEVDERLKWAFNMYDIDGNGYITR